MRHWNKPLTLRHRGIAACLLDGLSDKEIALATGCALKTVEHHLREMRLRLNARSTRHMVALLAMAEASGHDL